MICGRGGRRQPALRGPPFRTAKRVKQIVRRVDQQRDYSRVITIRIANTVSARSYNSLLPGAAVINVDSWKPDMGMESDEEESEA